MHCYEHGLHQTALKGTALKGSKKIILSFLCQWYQWYLSCYWDHFRYHETPTIQHFPQVGRK